MKRALSSLWKALCLTVFYMALGSPLVAVLYLVLALIGSEAILPYIVAAGALIVFCRVMRGG